MNRQKRGRLRAVFAVAMMLTLGLAMPWRMAFGDETSKMVTQEQSGGVLLDEVASSSDDATVTTSEKSTDVIDATSSDSEEATTTATDDVNTVAPRQDADESAITATSLSVSARAAGVTSETELSAAIAAAPTNGTETVITIAGDLTLTKKITLATGQNIRLVDDGTARTVTFKGLVSAFTVASGATLTISTSSADNGLLVFDGGSKSATSNTGFISCQGTLNWEGGTLQNVFFTSSAGKGPIVVSGAEASMQLTEGLFTGNQTGYFSGVITVNGGASLVMDGGTITQNKADSNRGAPVYISAVDSAEKATSFVMTGGTISHNEGSLSGGVFVGNNDQEFSPGSAIATAVINEGAVIADNSSSDMGGGVTVFMAGRLTMNGGTVSNNTAVTMGGGVCLWDGWVGYFKSLYMSSYNWTEEQAQSFWKTKWSVWAPAAFTMNGGTITGNQAPDDPSNNASGTGGGVYAGSSAITLNAGTISNNFAGKQGGGVYVPAVPYEIQMNKPLVTGNTASIIGGGLWSCPTGDVHVYVNNGGAIYGNTAMGAGNDVASIVKKAAATGDPYALLLSNRILGGGRAAWYDDGAIKTAGDLGEAEEGAARFPGTNLYDGSVTETAKDLALNDKVESVAAQAASTVATLSITGNSAPRGGGIGTNGSVIIGMDDPVRDVTVTKAWDDSTDTRGLQPESVTVYLLRDGVRIDTAVLNAANSWTATFKDLPQHKDGDKTTDSVYTIEEDAVPGYATTITGDATDGFTVTNKVIPDTTTSVKVTKVWDDGDNARDLRPDSVTVTLLRDGESYATVELNANNGWTATFDDLPAHQQGSLDKDFVYTVSENQADGYKQPVITGDATSGFIITNTVVPATPTPPTPQTPPTATTTTTVTRKVAIPKTGDTTPLTAIGVAAGVGALLIAGALIARYRGRKEN